MLRVCLQRKRPILRANSGTYQPIQQEVVAGIYLLEKTGTF